MLYSSVKLLPTKVGRSLAKFAPTVSCNEFPPSGLKNSPKNPVRRPVFLPLGRGKPPP